MGEVECLVTGYHETSRDAIVYLTSPPLVEVEADKLVDFDLSREREVQVWRR